MNSIFVDLFGKIDTQESRKDQADVEMSEFNSFCCRGFVSCLFIVQMVAHTYTYIHPRLSYAIVSVKNIPTGYIQWTAVHIHDFSKTLNISVRALHDPQKTIHS